MEISVMMNTVAPEPLCAPTVALLASMAGARYGMRTAIRYKHDAEWREQSYTELAAKVRNLSRGLLALDVQPGEHVALCAQTRPEWTHCDLAIAETGAVCVPVYPTDSLAEFEWVLSDAEVRVAICGNAEQIAKIEAVRSRLPRLEYLITIDPVGTQNPKAATMAQIVELGVGIPAGDVDRRAKAVRAEDVATIVYTSGSTGHPKGCVLSHGNWRAALDADQVNLSPRPDDVIYLYLPLAHLLARAVQLITFDNGATLAYFGGDIRQIVAELPEVQPTILPSVPRLFEKVYATVSGLAETMSVEELHTHVRGIFGSRVHQAITGGAPIAPEILQFFADCGVPIFEGYGMTETTAVISMNRQTATKIGTVGRPDRCVEVRIAEDGEILVRGANVFSGYHRNPAATAEVLKDGWLHTGDRGFIDADGYLTITGRKKDLIITSAGNNIAPANLENDLRRCRWIAEAVMLGDRRPYPVALITLDAGEILPWAKEHELPEDLAALSAHQDVKDLIQTELDRVNSPYAPTERIRRFAILDHAMTVEDGELTPTLKVKRSVVAERYASLIDTLYT
jgi:long-chain acyl-CoA synthetase